MIDKFIKYIKNILSSKSEISTCINEKKLAKYYGNCDKFTKSIDILAIADTHGSLIEEEFINYIKDKHYDICILLGDHYDRDINIILRTIPKEKIVGLLGNHDYDYLSNYDIKNINGQVIEINNVKILGMQGSFKYKNVNFPSFTQEESIEFFKDKEKVDIFVSHDKTYDETKLRDPAHQGLQGITKYLYEKNIPYHIHGHIHEPYEKELLNGTKEISVYSYKILKINK